MSRTTSLDHAPVASLTAGPSSSAVLWTGPWSNNDDWQLMVDDFSTPCDMHVYQPLLAGLADAVEKRVAAEREFAEQFPPGADPTARQLESELRQLSERRELQIEQLTSEFDERRAAVVARFQERLQSIDLAHREALRLIERRHNDEAQEIEQKFHDSTWVTSSVLDDTSEDSPKRKYEKFKGNLLKAREEQIALWQELEGEFKLLSERCGWTGTPPTEPTDPPRDYEAAQERFERVVEAARRQALDADRQWLPRLFTGVRPFLLGAGLAFALFIPLLLFAPPSALGVQAERFSGAWIGLSAGAATGASVLVTLVLYTLASMRHAEALRSLQQLVAEAGWVHQHWLRMAKDELQKRTREFEARQREVVAQREAALLRYQSAHQARRNEIETSREQEVRRETSRYDQQRRQLDEQREQELGALETEQQSRQRADDHGHEVESNRLQQRLSEHVGSRGRRQAQAWQSLKAEWESRIAAFESATTALSTAARLQYPDWEAVAAGWSPSREIPPALPCGGFQVDLAEIPNGIPEDRRLLPATTRFELPLLLDFPKDASLLLTFRGGSGRSAAIAAQQSLLLRLLTLLPPGTVRLTLLDPVGLGESYAGFMHLADFDDKLVTSRIWTEPSQFEARLADLTEHMENVFQKYLRNEFATIEEYNRHAGEVAEPYHFLVISDFPAKFSEIAARRLTSIITSGPRCGVYTLLSVDQSQQLPNNFRLSDIRDRMHELEWRREAFHDANVDLQQWRLRIDAPPEPDLFTKIVRKVGSASKDARRVEVAFARIAPAVADWWSQDSRREITIPLGRAGATKLQQLRLGRGTSQHMLVAGKTGSGKSTFLHALITNLALHYSPDQVRFFLIDFKKGVEFKDYAQFRLPHAEVIAIESDREFGVSALQRLDAVLQERGELFRRHGVQDIAGYRDANPQAVLPRLLLVVDEFQEFFTEDDKLSQSASLLLDRLVRQGRAFGIHVVLGSQTLGGAYSLARSTLGQVAVRVALQCSDADAHLILSEENTAARLLSRPGEAIYNDANGLLEGNHPFQIAWLSEAERETYLRQLANRAAAAGLTGPAPIVFEGNIASDASRNAALLNLLRARHQADGGAIPASPTIWLGESVDIGPPTQITFHRQAGAHLLLVGSDSEAAYGVLATALLALAAQSPAGSSPDANVTTTGTAALPSLYLFDGSPPDTVESGWWQRLSKAVPAAIRSVAPRHAAEALHELTAELERRLADSENAAPPLFVVIYNISKFRDLRKGEDDYGFGSFGSGGAEKRVEPGQLFADLLAKGPEVGMHCLLWCDTAGNVDRWFGRSALKELELRVVFQMNAADSSNLIDSPAASKLGVHRALLYREETGTSEKFRPYGPPAIDWVRSHMEGASPLPRMAVESAPSAAGVAALSTSAAPAVDALPEATSLDDFQVT